MLLEAFSEDSACLPQTDLVILLVLDVVRAVWVANCALEKHQLAAALCNPML